MIESNPIATHHARTPLCAAKFGRRRVRGCRDESAGATSASSTDARQPTRAPDVPGAAPGVPVAARMRGPRGADQPLIRTASRATSAQAVLGLAYSLLDWSSLTDAAIAELRIEADVLQAAVRIAADRIDGVDELVSECLSRPRICARGPWPERLASPRSPRSAGSTSVAPAECRTRRPRTTRG